ncbi:MAG: methyltransferase domain-containing protein [Candidatus Latescibacteria bacterium]|nr:methyltransferase domain-containing protein [Candidatus Latescibacterota bacterium]
MLVNPPDPHVMETVYTQFFVTYPSVGTTGIGSLRTKRFLNFVSDHIEPDSDVLEIGCYDGYFLSLLSKMGHHVTGCEPSPAGKIANGVIEYP